MMANLKILLQMLLLLSKTGAEEQTVTHFFGFKAAAFQFIYKKPEESDCVKAVACRT